MSPEEEIIRAGKARQVLESDIFKEACQEIFESLKDARLNSPVKDVELREKLWAQEVALEAILSKLKTVIETGQMAEKTLADKVKELWNNFN
jgi:hypothetical protein